MKTIKLKYVDFWPQFNYKEDIIYQFLQTSEKYKVEIVDENPEYLVFSMFGKAHFNYDCVKIFFTGEELCPDFNICDYAIGFEYMDFSDRYFRYPLYLVPQYNEDYDAMCDRPKFAKSEFCSFVYSNDNAHEIRNTFFRKLCEYKKVNSGGRLLNNIGGPVEDKVAFERKHKFSIAFENCSHPGYTTEKLMQAFAAGTVPIYWGDPLVEYEFNKDAFINVLSFDSIEDCINYVIYLDNDDTAYQKVLCQKAIIEEDKAKKQVNGRFFTFLDSIFSQDYEKAFRRTRICHNKKYFQMMADNYKVYVKDTYQDKLKRKINKIVHKF